MSNDYRAYVECDYNSIYHHGVKGMKWGIRRYQNPDGTLTPEGQKRYGKLEAYYRKQGLNDAQVAKALEKSIKRRGTMKAVGLGLIGAGLGYMAYRKLGGKYLDKVYRKGTKFHTLKNDVDAMSRMHNGHFYAAKGGLDRARYKSWFGQYAGQNKFDIESKALDKIKIASERSQKKVFNDLIKKDKDFADNLISKTSPLGAFEIMNVGNSNPRAVEGSRILEGLKEGRTSVNNLDNKDLENLHAFFDLQLVNHTNNPEGQKKYFDALKKAGYAGKVDLNDAFNGFNSKSSAVLFDPKKITQTSVRQLSDKEISDADTVNNLRQLGESALMDAPWFGLPMAAVGLSGGVEDFDKSTANKIKKENKKKK